MSRFHIETGSMLNSVIPNEITYLIDTRRCMAWGVTDTQALVGFNYKYNKLSGEKVVNVIFTIPLPIGDWGIKTNGVLSTDEITLYRK